MAVIIKTRSKLFMFLCGWGKFPAYVEAHHRLWWQWWFKAGPRE